MEEKKVFTEEEMRLLTKPELARVEGGFDINPAIRCEFCGQCFSSKLELKLHVKDCSKKNG